MTDMGSKRFSPTLHAENDSEAKAAVESLLEHLNLTQVTEHPDCYAVDLIGIRDGEVVGYVEVERKHGWEGDSFPFKTLRIPGRKRKYAELKLPTQFVVFNKTWTYAAVVDSKTLMASELTPSSNKFASNELFFNVPVDSVDFVEVR